MLASVSLVLVRPQLGENIGAVARVMGNFGLKDLRLVSPRDGWPNARAEKTACDSQGILQSVQIYQNVGEAVASCKVLFATSARLRDLNKPCIASNEVGSEVASLTGEVGVMFGCESNGLSNDELILADKVIYIPTDKEFSSLNLSHAVAIVCYEISKQFIIMEQPDLGTRATKQELLIMYEHLEKELLRSHFFRVPEKQKNMILNIRTMLGRAEFTKQELQIMHGIIHALATKGQGLPVTE